MYVFKIKYSAAARSENPLQHRKVPIRVNFSFPKFPQTRAFQHRSVHPFATAIRCPAVRLERCTNWLYHRQRNTSARHVLSQAQRNFLPAHALAKCNNDNAMKHEASILGHEFAARRSIALKYMRAQPQ